MNLKSRLYRLLRWSERVFRTDMVYVAKGGFWVLAGQGISMAGSLFMAIAFARLIPKEVYGNYRYVLSIAGIIASLSLGGLGNAAARAIAQGNEGTFLRAFSLNLKWSIFMFIGSGAVSVYYLANGNTTLAIAFLIVGCFSPLLDSFEMYNVLPSAKRDFRWVTMGGFIRSVITTAVMITTLFLTQNIIVIIFVYFLVHTAMVAFLFFITYRHFKPNKAIDYDSLRLGKHMSVLNIFGTIAGSIDQVLLFHFLGPIDVAQYNYATAMPDNLQFINKTVGVLALPKYATIDKTIAQRDLSRKSFTIFLGSLMVYVFYLLTARLIFTFFFPQYLTSLTYSLIYGVTLLFSAVLPLAVLDAQIAIKQKYALNIYSNVFKLIALILGIVYFGIWGAIIARIGSKIFGVGLAFYYAYRI
jgi:O-antigen/teichoic acid export membrane protein